MPRNMNKYPVWKYLLILAIVLVGAIYALPNLFGEYPAVQVSPTRTTKVDAAVLARIEQTLKDAKLEYLGADIEEGSARVRFADTELQLKARERVARELGEGFTVALNLVPATPHWLDAIGARPMYLGLDLRGGVHFLMQVDMRAVLKKSEESVSSDLRRILQKERIRYLTVVRAEGSGVEVRFRDGEERDKARAVLRKELPDLEVSEIMRGAEFALAAHFKEQALIGKAQRTLEQNMLVLRRRLTDEQLGVTEPVIQQQGSDRIVVQLPGVQDTAKAKAILGRTATLEIMLVDEENNSRAVATGYAPPGTKLYKMRDGRPILLKGGVIYSGENIEEAGPGFDSQTGRPIVSITLDAKGAGINQRVTGENIGKRMAVIYIEIKSDPKFDAEGRPVLDEQGRQVRESRRIEEVITAPVIRSQLGKRFQIEGLEGTQEANELALLLRAGALAAPVSIVEERTVGPSLGQENIEQGIKATWIGLVAVVVFMIVYYRAFGLIANISLFLNLVLLVAILSIFQATLTLPGIAGILLTLGMAVDANVLINERIREELRNGNSPQASIHAGFQKAFATIADANITTLIAAVMLFYIGTGPIKGFATTLSIGILTTMFTAVMCSRAMANLAFGSRRLEKLPV
jgi:preprotein translocase subunit SecD